MNEIKSTDQPFVLFAQWYQLASSIKGLDPSAASLATANKEGIPSVRMVLIKEYKENSFVFYTNLNSRKAKELNENPYASLCFYWMEIDKQVRVSGKVERVTDEEADHYFASRARESQIGAWASKQSQRMDDANELQNNYLQHETQFKNKVITRPAYWTGFRIIPQQIEFWSRGEHRLHQRVQFNKINNQWLGHFLFP